MDKEIIIEEKVTEFMDTLEPCILLLKDFCSKNLNGRAGTRMFTLLVNLKGLSRKTFRTFAKQQDEEIKAIEAVVISIKKSFDEANKNFIKEKYEKEKLAHDMKNLKLENSDLKDIIVGATLLNFKQAKKEDFIISSENDISEKERNSRLENIKNLIKKKSDSLQCNS